MRQFTTLVWKLRILRDTRGQDLIEYALLVGLVTVAAGVIVPGVTDSVDTIFGKVKKVLSTTASHATHHH